MNLQFADRSSKKAAGILKEVLVQIDKFTFPVDWYVLDMEKSENVPMILGRPFLSTARALIDCDGGQVTIRVGDQEVSYSVSKSIQVPSGSPTGFFIEETSDDFDDFMDKQVMAVEAEYERLIDNLNNHGVVNLDQLAADFEDELREEALAVGPLSKLNDVELTSGDLKSSLEEPPVDLVLKPLPKHLKYVFLREGDKLPLIISAKLSRIEELKHTSCGKTKKLLVGR